MVQNEQTVKGALANLINKATENDNKLSYTEVKGVFEDINYLSGGQLPDTVQDNLMDTLRSLGITIVVEQVEPEQVESEQIEQVEQVTNDESSLVLIKQDLEKEVEEDNKDFIDSDLVISEIFEGKDDFNFNIDEQDEYTDDESNIAQKVVVTELVDADELEDEDLYDEDDTDYGGYMITDSVNAYLKAIGDIPLLTPEEEYKTAMDWFETRNPEARQKLSNSNLRLVVSVAKKYLWSGIDLLDLVQEGSIGLLTAVDRFDYRRGYRFTTYALWWIRQAIQRYVMNFGRTMRLPIHVVEALNKINKVERDYVNTHGESPSLEYVAEKTGFTTDKIKDIKQSVLDIVSLDQPVRENEDGNSTLGDFIKDESGGCAVDNIVEDSERAKAIQEILNTLDERERYVILKRFGFGTNGVHTLEMVGSELGVTRERIRQIEAKALKKLRKGRNGRELQRWFDA